MKSTLVDRAAAFAIKAHEEIGQRRKYTNDPYFTHPINVYSKVLTARHVDDEMRAAALLHDVVEDTNRTIDEVRAEFGDNVASLVAELTDVSRPEDGNRKIRKAIDRDHLAKASARAKTIKLADIIDNTASIIEHDHDFAKVYLPENLELLQVLKEGDESLYREATGIVELSIDIFEGKSK